MTVWMFRIKGTKLYYRSVSGRFSFEKSNFGEMSGKVYYKKPKKMYTSLTYISKPQIEKYKLSVVDDYRQYKLDMNHHEIELVEFELVEKN